MTTELTWNEIILRLAATFVAGALIGLNRSEEARPAGLRTTLLVCLAASIAMIQTNALLNTVGKAPDSFIVMDLMRLPLGILSGMGFIGAGAILRRDNVVIGVTTAATLWFVTVMGLCFGGGQFGLGLASLGLGLIVLWGLKQVEKVWHQDRRGKLEVTVGANGPDEEMISSMLAQSECRIVSWSVDYSKTIQEVKFSCAVRWRELPSETRPPAFLKTLGGISGVIGFNWHPQ
jgi:putative Mg2+ transporter-C (MgtC) family protein